MEEPAISRRATPGSTGQLALDLSPRPPADTTARFIGYLRSEPSPTDVAQELVLGFLGDFEARAAVISTIEPDATLRIVGHFGLTNADLEAIGAPSLWDRLPAAAAIRQRAPLVLPTFDAVVTAFPAMRESWPAGHALVDAPLFTASSVVGSVFVQFEAEGTTVASAAQVLEALTDVYVLYLMARTHVESQQAEATGAAPPRASATVESRPKENSGRAFSKRQRMVLEFLGDGLTYDQIAARIGYSHSTVRMELMRMYRVLGVSSRRDAIAVARRLGLVEDSQRALVASLSHRAEQSE